MLQAATGVLTGDQIPTQQKQDLANSANELSTIAFMSKGELMRTCERLALEKDKLKAKILVQAKEVIFYQRECVVLNNTIIQMNRDIMDINPEPLAIMRVIKAGD